MKLYEYQAKSIFHRYRLPAPEGYFTSKPSEIPKILRRLGTGPWMVKAQVLAGGRGKAGGVQIVKKPPDALAYAKKLIGRPLVTHQTGPKGEKVVGVLIEKPQKNVAKEMYVSLLLDRKAGVPVLLASAEGGMDIEELAKTKPDAIHRLPIDPQLRLPAYQARNLARTLGFRGPSLLNAAAVFCQLARIFFDSDASLVEVNPLAMTTEGTVVALDGKITTDDNALYRHPDQQEWKNLVPQPSAERKAAKARISYIQLEGNVGCLVNGAGLAMATMDIIKHHGGEPANFLDVGGGANTDQVAAAFQIILSDKRAKGILVNIFGGIMRCDVIANGVVAAVKKTKLKVPLVVRLEGTKSEEGKKILAQSRLRIEAATELDEAARKIVQLVKSGSVNGNSRR